jgi:hypothetical protein
VPQPGPKTEIELSNQTKLVTKADIEDVKADLVAEGGRGLMKVTTLGDRTYWVARSAVVSLYEAHY